MCWGKFRIQTLVQLSRNIWSLDPRTVILCGAHANVFYKRQGGHYTVAVTTIWSPDQRFTKRNYSRVWAETMTGVATKAIQGQISVLTHEEFNCKSERHGMKYHKIWQSLPETKTCFLSSSQRVRHWPNAGLNYRVQGPTKLCVATSFGLTVGWVSAATAKKVHLK